MSAPLPLEGIRALTLEQIHAWPWGTAFLADLGAQVIRIESVEHLQDRKAGEKKGVRNHFFHARWPEGGLLSPQEKG